MADQDFNIKVVTTADTTGLKQTREEIEKIQKAKQDAGAKALFDRIPPKGPTAPEETADKAGASFTRAFTSAAGLGYLVSRVITGIAQETNKVTGELDKQGEHLVDLEHKWTAMAKAATSAEDVGKIAESGAREIESLGKAIEKAATPDLSIGATMVDSLVTRFKNLGRETEDAMGPNEELNKRLFEGLQLAQQELIETNARAIELGRTFTNSFDKKQAEPLADALSEIAGEMAKAKDEQDALTGSMLRTKQGIDRYNELAVTLKDLTHQTDLLTQADDRQQRKAEEAARAAEKEAELEAKQAKIAEDWQRSHDDTLRDSKEELAIGIAKAQGNEELAESLQRELDIRHDITDLMQKGLDYQEALTAAQAKETLKELGSSKKTESPAAVAAKERDENAQKKQIRDQISNEGDPRRRERLWSQIDSINARQQDRRAPDNQMITILQKLLAIWQ